MRLPALRLTIPRPSFDWFEGIDGRRILLYTLYTFVLFAIFLVANFPHDVVVKRALRELDRGAIVPSVERARFAWFNGYELQGVKLVARPRDPSTPPLLESPSLYVRPGLDGLMRGRLSSLYLSGSLYGGEADAQWSYEGGMNRATLKLDDVQLGRYLYLRSLLDEGQLAGRLSGVLSAEGRGAIGNGRAAGELSIEQGAITGAKIKGFGVPDLHFERVSLKFALQSSRLEVQELRADGDEVKLSGEGQIVLRQPLDDSVLNLRLNVDPGPNSPDAVRGLIGLIPRPKNARLDAPITVTGTLKHPRFR